MMAVDIVTEPTLTPGNPTPLFSAPYRAWSGFDRGHSFDLATDGERFLMIKEGPGSGSTASVTPIIYVQNWIEELKERLPLE